MHVKTTSLGISKRYKQLHILQMTKGVNLLTVVTCITLFNVPYMKVMFAREISVNYFILYVSYGTILR